MYLFFFVFTSRPPLTEVPCFPLWYLDFHQIYQRHKPRPDANVFHSFPVVPGFLDLPDGLL